MLLILAMIVTPDFLTERGFSGDSAVLILFARQLRVWDRMLRKIIQLTGALILLASLAPAFAQDSGTRDFNVSVVRSSDGSFNLTITDQATGQVYTASGVNPIDPADETFEGTVTVDGNQSVVSVISQLSGTQITGTERAALVATVRIIPPPGPPPSSNTAPGPPENPGPPDDNGDGNNGNGNGNNGNGNGNNGNGNGNGPPDGAPPTPDVPAGPPSNPGNPQGPVVPTPPVNTGNGGAGGSPT